MVPPATGRPTSSIGKRIVATLLIAFLLIFCPPGAAHANVTEDEGQTCLFGVSVDLTHAAQNDSGFFAKSGYFFPREEARLVAGVWHGCICDVDPCMPVCPPEGYSTRGAAYFLDDYAYSLPIPGGYTKNVTIDHEDETPNPEVWIHSIMRDPPCPYGNLDFVLRENYEDQVLYILRNGSILISRADESEMWFYDFMDYCLQERGEDFTLTPKVCFMVTDPMDYTAGICIINLVALPFVIATFIVYSVLQELRNTYGTMLRCYLCCLIVNYITAPAEETLRHRVGGIIYSCSMFVAYFWTTAGYLWLNVMSFDIWWRFSDFGSLRRSGAASDRKRFIWCSIYAWGVALVFLAIYVCLVRIPGLYNYDVMQAVLFRGPVGVIIVCNICFFILTTIKMVQHNRDTRRHLNNEDSKRHDENKYWFCLHLKLCVAMGLMLGLTWLTKTIYLARVWKYLWFGPKIVNMLQGILIFVIFVCKKNIWLSIKERFNDKDRCVIIRRLPGCGCISRTASDSPTTAVPGEQENSSSNFKNNSQLTRTVTMD